MIYFVFGYSIVAEKRADQAYKAFQTVFHCLRPVIVRANCNHAHLQRTLTDVPFCCKVIINKPALQ